MAIRDADNTDPHSKRWFKKSFLTFLLNILAQSLPRYAAERLGGFLFLGVRGTRTECS